MDLESLELLLPALAAKGNALVVAKVSDDGRVVTFAILGLRLAVRR